MDSGDRSVSVARGKVASIIEWVHLISLNCPSKCSVPFLLISKRQEVLSQHDIRTRNINITGSCPSTTTPPVLGVPSCLFIRSPKITLSRCTSSYSEGTSLFRIPCQTSNYKPSLMLFSGGICKRGADMQHLACNIKKHRHAVSSR